MVLVPGYVPLRMWKSLYMAYMLVVVLKTIYNDFHEVLNKHNSIIICIPLVLKVFLPGMVEVSSAARRGTNAGRNLKY